MSPAFRGIFIILKIIASYFNKYVIIEYNNTMNIRKKFYFMETNLK